MSKQTRDALRQIRKVMLAGVWLIRHGHGNLRLMPYASGIGAWRCAFHPCGQPRDELYRYSSADGADYLAAHPEIRLRPNLSPAELAKAIWSKAPAELRRLCEGPVTPEMERWAAESALHLDAGSVPTAFGEYSDWTDWGHRWALISLVGDHEERRMTAIPGFELP